MSHEKYIIKLFRLAKALNVKIVRSSNEEGNATWYPSFKKIKVDRNLEGTQLISTLLHELGHVIDDLQKRTSKEYSKVYYSYKNIYKGKPTKKQRKLVLRYERRAWYLGEELARLMNIRLGKWYYEDAQECIKAYKT